MGNGQAVLEETLAVFPSAQAGVFSLKPRLRSCETVIPLVDRAAAEKNPICHSAAQKAVLRVVLRACCLKLSDPGDLRAGNNYKLATYSPGVRKQGWEAAVESS